MNPSRGGRREPSPNPLHIETGAHAALLAHLLRDPKCEMCGLLSGLAQTASRFHPVDNVASDPTRRYAMDAAMQIEAFRRMREAGEQLLAIVHSHPNGEARPSATDIAEANYPDAVYVIVSLRGGTPQLRGFRLQPGQEPRPVRLEIARPSRGDGHSTEGRM